MIYTEKKVGKSNKFEEEDEKRFPNKRFDETTDVRELLKREREDIYTLMNVQGIIKK